VCRRHECDGGHIGGMEVINRKLAPSREDHGKAIRFEAA
jgi:hypothetical protein